MAVLTSFALAGWALSRVDEEKGGLFVMLAYLAAPVPALSIGAAVAHLRGWMGPRLTCLVLVALAGVGALFAVVIPLFAPLVLLNLVYGPLLLLLPTPSLLKAAAR